MLLFRARRLAILMVYIGTVAGLLPEALQRLQANSFCGLSPVQAQCIQKRLYPYLRCINIDTKCLLKGWSLGKISAMGPTLPQMLAWYVQ